MASYHKWLLHLMHDRVCLQCCPCLQTPKGCVLYGNRVGHSRDLTAGDRAHALVILPDKESTRLKSSSNDSDEASTRLTARCGCRWALICPRSWTAQPRSTLTRTGMPATPRWRALLGWLQQEASARPPLWWQHHASSPCSPWYTISGAWQGLAPFPQQCVLLVAAVPRCRSRHPEQALAPDLGNRAPCEWRPHQAPPVQLPPVQAKFRAKQCGSPNSRGCAPSLPVCKRAPVSSGSTPPPPAQACSGCLHAGG